MEEITHIFHIEVTIDAPQSLLLTTYTQPNHRSQEGLFSN